MKLLGRVKTLPYSRNYTWYRKIATGANVLATTYFFSFFTQNLTPFSTQYVYDKGDF